MRSGKLSVWGVLQTKIDDVCKSCVVQSILNDPSQVVTLDANFFIPPDRQNEGARFHFESSRFIKMWVDPFFKTFPKLAIHEAVLAELLSETKIRSYVDEKISSSKLLLLKDVDLTADEMLVRNTKERLIAANTQYDPLRDNKCDRGEVKSLSYLGAKGYIYFVSNDRNAIRLVEYANKLGTSLDEQRVIKFYEGIYLLSHYNAVPQSDLRLLYKYLYGLTKRDKNRYHDWGIFIAEMKRLYSSDV
jgi:hypothetical protein